MKKILFFGDINKKSNSYLLSESLRRLSYEVTSIDNKSLYKPTGVLSGITNKFNYITGYRYAQTSILKNLKQKLINVESFDLIWVVSGEFFGPEILKLLKSYKKKIILFNEDDSTGKRDGNRFKSLLSSIKYYDLCVVRIEKNVNEFKSLGANKVIKTILSYDEIAHKPMDNKKDLNNYSAEKYDISFIGTWMKNENRDLFLLQLINQGLNVSIWGDRWHKSPYWKKLQKHHISGAIYGQDYTRVIQESKICLGMVSRGNKDLHTRRSLEIPYIGSVLCAERTTLHQEMFEEGEEAVFWDTPEECASICKELLVNNRLRESIRIAGFNKVRKLNVGNEDFCRKVLKDF
jgi:spore maturation protein CgeB